MSPRAIASSVAPARRVLPRRSWWTLSARVRSATASSASSRRATSPEIAVGRPFRRLGSASSLRRSARPSTTSWAAIDSLVPVSAGDESVQRRQPAQVVDELIEIAAGVVDRALQPIAQQSAQRLPLADAVQDVQAEPDALGGEIDLQRLPRAVLMRQVGRAQHRRRGRVRQRGGVHVAGGGVPLGLRPHVLHPSIRAEDDAAVRRRAAGLVEPDVREGGHPGVEAIGGEIEHLPRGEIQRFRGKGREPRERAPETGEDAERRITFRAIQERAHRALSGKAPLQQVPGRGPRLGRGEADHLGLQPLRRLRQAALGEQLEGGLQVLAQRRVPQQQPEQGHGLGRREVAQRLPAERDELREEGRRRLAVERRGSHQQVRQRPVSLHVGRVGQSRVGHHGGEVSGLGERLRREGGPPGLAEVLLDEAPIGQVVFRTDHVSRHVARGGRAHPQQAHQRRLRIGGAREARHVGDRASPRCPAGGRAGPRAARRAAGPPAASSARSSRRGGRRTAAGRCAGWAGARAPARARRSDRAPRGGSPRDWARRR